MGINNEQDSKMYKIGYRCGYKSAILALIDLCDPLIVSEIIDKLIDKYNSYPLIEKMKIGDIHGDHN